jgi:acetyl-CoA carboxylase biotin carboxyl carrier protein
MQHLDLKQLTEWLSSSHIECLDLSSPQGHISLRRGAAQLPVQPIPTKTAPTQTALQPTAVAADAGYAVQTVRTQHLGIFLSHHPLRSAPLVQPGQTVTAGQCIGLLQVGTLLLPIAAPGNGVAGAYLVEPGQTLGYGTPVLNIHPT